MAEFDTQQPLLPPLLDRLIDEESHQTVEPGWSKRYRLRDLMESVRRDLEDLLNTRQAPEGTFSKEGEISRSLLTYGLPDLSERSAMVPDDLDYIRRIVQKAIEDFEPRLTQVDVAVADTDRQSLGSLRIVIHAVLNVEPVCEAVTFDTKFELDKSAIEVNVES